MSQLPHILFQLGEALGVGGLLVVLLFLCGGTVWVVMSVRSNKVDHDRLEAKIDKGLERLEGMVNTVGASVHTVRESVEGKIDTVGASVHTVRESVEGKIDTVGASVHTVRESLEGKIENSRKESRDELRSINTRLDGIILQKPPDRSAKS